MAAPSFAEMVSSETSSPPDPNSLVFPSSYHELFSLGNTQLLHPAARKSGKPALFLSEEEQQLLVEPLRFTLVAKFQSRHPKLELVRESLGKQKFKGQCTVGQLDGRHLLIQFKSEEDYALLFSRRVNSLANGHVKILKWTADFDFRREPPIVPVWLKFPRHKFHYFNQKVLYSLGSAFGRPLKLNQATFQLSRPSCARILVELDISLNHSDSIWIGSESNGYWQEVLYEGIPYYCKKCCIFGHRIQDCYIAHPELKPNSKSVWHPPADSEANPSTLPPLNQAQNPLHLNTGQNALLSAQPRVHSVDPTSQEVIKDQSMKGKSAVYKDHLWTNPQLEPSFQLLEDYSSLKPDIQDAAELLPAVEIPPRNSKKGKQKISFSPVAKALKEISGNPSQGIHISEPQHQHISDSESDSESDPVTPATNTSFDQVEEGEVDINECRDDSNSNFSSDSLIRINEELNAGWIKQKSKRGRPRGTRELQSLLKEANRFGMSSPSKARRKGYLSQ